MKFVDEAEITVQGGKGGDGCLSFRRERFVPKGGPDGGDGGRGGSVHLVAVQGLNTLADFRYTRRFQAGNGAPGMGRDKSGRSGDDLYIRVPPGTLAYDARTGELIADLLSVDAAAIVAAGGRGGLGNTHFKSSTNRAPRRTTDGRPGDQRVLRLELRLLADVGLLGLPNAGKSTFLRAVSQARPKVADYPFTTLYPQLGVVRVEAERSFVLADIPGLIGGASQGAGLGARFLRHLGRTRLLLHMVDLAPADDHDVAAAIRTVEAELKAFSQDLAKRPRWLVLNKVDVLDREDRAQRRQRVVKAVSWTGPVFEISAISGEGCELLCRRAMSFLDEQGRQERAV